MPANIVSQIASAQAVLIALAVAETEKLDLTERAVLAATTVEMLAEINPAVPREALIVTAAAMWGSRSIERKILRRVLRLADSV
jgi:hypothetical protein